jgi:hypothetical protein
VSVDRAEFVPLIVRRHALGYCPGRGETGWQSMNVVAEPPAPEISNWWKKVPEWLQVGLAAVAAIAGPITVVLGIRELFGLEGPGWAVVLAWFNAALVVLSLAVVFVLQFRHHSTMAELRMQYRRDRALTATMPKMHEAFHKLRDAGVVIQSNESPFAYDPLVTQALAGLNDVFSVVAGTPCRLCVKELVVSADAPPEFDANDVRFLGVRTLWRHDGSKRPEKDALSPLHDNTDFQQVMDPAQTSRCFFSNDLDSVPNYRNAHRTGDPADFDYNATIVWPIQKRKGDGRIGLLGFLCLDALEKDKFKYDPDFHLGASFADTLFTAMALRDASTA